MSKRKTDFERKEDLLNVLSNEDHDKAIAFQKTLGITIGQLIDILTAGTICVSKTREVNPKDVEYRKVRLNVQQATWDFDDFTDDIYGKGRSTRAFGDTYTLNAPDMEVVCVKRIQEEAKALQNAAEGLDAAGLFDLAEELRSQATDKLMLTEQYQEE